MVAPQRITAIPAYIKILVTLNFLGHGSYQQGTGAAYLLGLSQPSVSRCIYEVIRTINNHLLREKIKFPTTNFEKEQKCVHFQNKYNMSNIIGAIDCTHIAIIAPPENDIHFPARVYYGRRGYPTINTQIICDSNLRILNVNARFPGSCHDSAIWESSNIKRHLMTKFINGELNNKFLIGDSGYPLEPWLMTPVDNAAEGTPESRYNVRHISARNCIERLNGVLKSRFRCLLRHRALNYKPNKVGLIINACAILHNLAQEYNIQLPDNVIEMPNQQGGQNIAPVVPQQGRWFIEGQQRRNNIIQNLM